MACSPCHLNAATGRASVAAAMGGLVVWAWLGAIAAGPALADEIAVVASPEVVRPELLKVIARRQSESRRLSGAMRVIGRFLKGEGANVSDVGAAAEIIRAVGGQFNHDLFPEGTAVGVGRSAARQEVWQEWDIFKERSAALQTAAGRLVTAAATGNAEAVRAPIVAVGQACGSCHELFRRRVP